MNQDYRLYIMFREGLKLMKGASDLNRGAELYWYGPRKAGDFRGM